MQQRWDASSVSPRGCYRERWRKKGNDAKRKWRRKRSSWPLLCSWMREEGRGVYGSEREEMAEGTRCSRHEKKERPETRWRERGGEQLPSSRVWVLSSTRDCWLKFHWLRLEVGGEAVCVCVCVCVCVHVCVRACAHTSSKSSELPQFLRSSTHSHWLIIFSLSPVFMSSLLSDWLSVDILVSLSH